jgi:uncharacterized membrane protein
MDVFLDPLGVDWFIEHTVGIDANDSIVLLMVSQNEVRVSKDLVRELYSVKPVSIGFSAFVSLYELSGSFNLIVNIIKRIHIVQFVFDETTD